MSATERGQIQVPLSNELWGVFDRATEIAKEQRIFPVNVDCALLALLELEDVGLTFIEANTDPDIVARSIRVFMAPNCAAHEAPDSSFNFEPVAGSKCIKRAYELQKLFEMGTREITVPIWFLALLTVIKEQDPETVDMLAEVVNLEKLEEAALQCVVQSVEVN